MFGVDVQPVHPSQRDDRELPVLDPEYHEPGDEGQRRLQQPVGADPAERRALCERRDERNGDPSGYGESQQRTGSSKGNISEFGRDAGIPTPIHDTATAALAAASSRDRSGAEVR